MALVLDPRMRRILANLRKLEAETTGFARYKVCAYCGEFERVDYHQMICPVNGNRGAKNRRMCSAAVPSSSSRKPS